MPSRKAAPASAAPTEARALVDLPDLQANAGQLFSADPLTIAALVACGKADDHPDAVAYAKALPNQEN